MAAALFTIPGALIVIAIVLFIADNLGGGRWY